MSIYIRDLDAPKECNACDYTAYNVRNGMSYCRITGTTLARDFECIDDGFKPDDCPIFQVPKHGDLIDRDAVCYQLEKQETIDGQPRAIRRARRIASNAPTIIPASDTDTDVPNKQEAK